MSEPQLSDVLAELRELRAEVTTLRAQVAERAPTAKTPARSTTTPTVDVDGTDAVSRRHALRTAGIVAAGALAGGTALVAAATPVAAASGTFDGNPAVTAVGSPAVKADTTDVSQNAIEATANYSNSIGVSASAFSTNSIGVLGIGTRAGVWGAASDGGVSGVHGEANGTNGLYGVRGVGSTSSTGVRGESGSIAVQGIATSSGTGVWGESAAGAAVRGDASSTGRGAQFSSALGVALEASGGTIGTMTTGTYSALLLGATAFAPTAASSHAYEAGEMTRGPGDVLWYCVESGTPGKWRTLSAPTGAGSFYAVTPARAYDSRLSTYPQNGVLSSGQNRTISVANRYDVNGTLVTSNFVPAGATAVFANVTVVDTVGAGYLAVNPGGTTAVAASTINWSASGQVLANGISLTLNASREITVVNGSGGSTQFIIDITGYWL
jgi:hypothetical protein